MKAPLAFAAGALVSLGAALHYRAKWKQAIGWYRAVHDSKVAAVPLLSQCWQDYIEKPAAEPSRE